MLAGRLGNWEMMGINYSFIIHHIFIHHIFQLSRLFLKNSDLTLYNSRQLSSQYLILISDH